MAEHGSAPHLNNPEVRHELSDVDLRRITYWGITLTVTVLLILALLVWLFGFFSRRESAHGHRPVGVPSAAPKSAPPQLQISPSAEMSAMRAAEDRLLNHYGWVDKANGIVRLPIERAMELTIQRGLPARRQ